MDQKEAAELLLKTLGPGGRLEKMQSQIDKIGSGNDTAQGLSKAAHILGGGQMAAGWDGGAMNAGIVRPGRQKSLGMGDGTNKSGSYGEWLQWVAAASLGDKVPALRRPMDKCVKAFKDFDPSWDVRNKTWQAETVSKAPNAEGAGATGGYLVPTQFYERLLQFVAEKSWFKAMCTTLPMAGRELRFPFLNQQATTASSATNYTGSNFFGGVYFSWTPEAATYPQTNPGFQMGELVARDLVGITICSNQLLQDSAIALDTLLTTLFSEALAWQLDYAFLRGNGVNQPLGVLNAPGTIASTRAGSNNLLTSLSDMLGHALNVGEEWSNYVWVINQSVLPYLIRLTNAATNSPFLIFLNPAPSSGSPMANPWPATLFGRPVIITEKLPAYTTQGDIALIDASKFLCGDRMAIQIEASQFPYFTSNQMVWRTIWRGDGQPWFNNYVTLADGTTTVSPMVILAT